MSTLKENNPRMSSKHLTKASWDLRMKLEQPVADAEFGLSEELNERKNWELWKNKGPKNDTASIRQVSVSWIDEIFSNCLSRRDKISILRIRSAPEL